MDPTPSSAVEAPPDLVYARLGPRIQAVLRDLMVYCGILALLVLIGSVLPPGPLMRGVAVVLAGAFVFYEPVLVTWRGGTLGHRSLGLRVVRAGDGQAVSFPRALLRFLMQTVFGILGFALIEATRKRQALHDLAAGTVVVPRTADPGLSETFASERSIPPGTLSAPRRLLVILSYVILLFVVLAVGSASLYSTPCLMDNLCNGTDRILENVLGFGFVILTAVIIVLGWTGRLPGARLRSPASTTS